LVLRHEHTELESYSWTYLLDNVGTKLGFRELNDLVFELKDERCQVYILTIDKILEDIVSELILRQFDGVFDELFVELCALLVGSMIYTPLEDTTAVLVGRDFDAIVCHRIKNKLQLVMSSKRYLFIIRIKLVKAFLDNMITIEIFREQNDIWPQRILDKFDLQLASPCGNIPALQESNAQGASAPPWFHAD